MQKKHSMFSGSIRLILLHKRGRFFSIPRIHADIKYVLFRCAVPVMRFNIDFHRRHRHHHHLHSSGGFADGNNLLYSNHMSFLIGKSIVQPLSRLFTLKSMFYTPNKYKQSNTRKSHKQRHVVGVFFGIRFSVRLFFVWYFPSSIIFVCVSEKTTKENHSLINLPIGSAQTLQTLEKQSM